MKKIWILLLCVVLMCQTAAAAGEKTEPPDREALLAGLYEADIATVRRAIDLRMISCTELTEYYLERIEKYNDTFQCFITICDNAMDVARQRDRDLAAGRGRGALFGIPVVVKDNIDYKGYPTTNGVRMRARPAEDNAAVVQYLVDEGAVILGKTNMSAAAQDAVRSVSAGGLETHNAYNPCLASGGSSGGSAAAVSLNFAMAGLGTDTNVSLRYPSALNGCVSMRPTKDLVERDGCVILNSGRDTPGAITRSAEDQALMLDVITGGEHGYTEHLNPGAIRGMRFGVLSELSYPIPGLYDRGESRLDPEICRTFDRAVEELKACGAKVTTVSMPRIFYMKSAADEGGSRSRERYYEKLQELMEENRVDILVYPTYLHAPHYADREHLKGKDIYKQPYICNCACISPLTGAPEITVPIGTHSRGAGIGMELFAQRNEEQLLLDAACGYMKQFDHRTAPKTAPELHRGSESLKQILETYRNQPEERPSIEKETPEETVPETVPETAPETVPEEPVTEEVFVKLETPSEEPTEAAELPTEETEPSAAPQISWIPYAVLLAGVTVLMGIQIHRGRRK